MAQRVKNPPPPERAPSADTSRQVAESNDTIKETLESIIIAFILAFVFRAYVVEAFVIPTGSMAPTLLGRNLRVFCEDCGYRLKADPRDPAGPDGRQGRSHLNAKTWIRCPMCHWPNGLEKGTRIYAGDRILVQKYIYSLSEPKRWDVVVFKNPGNPAQNYIKRLVGLPEQSLWIIEGNTYFKKTIEGAESWRIARKTARPAVQAAVWQPVYHSLYVPRDVSRRRTGTNTWHPPWVALDHADQWQIDGLRSYRYVGTETSTIRFNFDKRPIVGADLYPYNHLSLRSSSSFTEPIEDIRLAVSFQPAHEGLNVELLTTARLGHAADVRVPESQTVRAIIDSAGSATLLCGDEEVGPVQVGPFHADGTRTVELWHVDQEVSLHVDGRIVLFYRYELAIDALTTRQPQAPGYRPDVRISVSGAPVALHRVNVDRDLYYSSSKPGGRDLGRATLDKYSAKFRGAEINLKANQFYCLGDNSPSSQDSRYWESPTYLVKKHMLPHEDMPRGIVPRELMMGRAFFVYYPAGLAINERWLPVVPNFAEMRSIH